MVSMKCCYNEKHCTTRKWWYIGRRFRSKLWRCRYLIPSEITMVMTVMKNIWVIVILIWFKSRTKYDICNLLYFCKQLERWMEVPAKKNIIYSITYLFFNCFRFKSALCTWTYLTLFLIYLLLSTIFVHSI